MKLAPQTSGPVILAVLWCLMAAGCRDSTNSEGSPGSKTGGSDAIKDESLVALVVDDRALGEVAQRIWNSRTESQLDIEYLDAADLLSRDRLAPADVIIFPSWMIAELASRDWLAPFNEETLDDPQLAWRDVHSLIRLREATWGDNVVALPLGAEPALLYYRRDLFEALGLDPPTTWKEYAAAAQALNDRETVQAVHPESELPENWTGTVEPVARDEGGRLLLARAAAYLSHPGQFSGLFDYGTMEPRIDSPAVVRALTELRDAGAYRPEEAADSDEGLRRLLAGEAAMAIAWLETPSTDVDTSRMDAIGVALLPGSDEVYRHGADRWEPRSGSAHVPLIAASGRMAGVVRGSSNRRAAARLLVWLTGKDWSSEISPAGTGTAPYRASQRSLTELWVKLPATRTFVDEYAAAIASTWTQAQCLDALRLPGRDDYRRALNDAVSGVLEGEQDPTAALEQVAEEWRSITENLGVEAQRRAYLRTLGLTEEL